VERLERLWAGTFGNEDLARNMGAGTGREGFWKELFQRLSPDSVLEVGCNVGANLIRIAEILPPARLCGIDVNDQALGVLRERLPEVKAVRAAARALPFRDGAFDLVFTAGVLIHQPEESLFRVMGEAVRCARRYVLCNEYYAPETTPVEYRGQSGALFKRDYGRIYQELFPRLTLLGRGILGAGQGWDDVTWWLFARGPEPLRP